MLFKRKITANLDKDNSLLGILIRIWNVYKYKFMCTKYYICLYPILRFYIKMYWWFRQFNLDAYISKINSWLIYLGN